MESRTQTKLFGLTVVAILVIGAVTAGGAVSSQLSASSHDAANAPAQDSAFLRVAHASPDAPAVNVSLDGETVLTNVSFGTISDYLNVPAGEYPVTITQAGEPGRTIYEGSVSLAPRTTSTIAASGVLTFGSAQAFEPTAFTDDAYRPSADESAIRIAHLSPDAGAVDVVAVPADDATTPTGTATEMPGTDTAAPGTETAAPGTETAMPGTDTAAPGTDTAAPGTETAMPGTDTAAPGTDTAAPGTETAMPGTETAMPGTDAAMPGTETGTASSTDAGGSGESVVLADNVTFRNASDYVNVPAGDYTVEIRAEAEDNQGPVVATVDVSLEGGNAYTAMAVGFTDTDRTGEPFGVILTEDASHTVHLPSEDTNGNMTATPGTATAMPGTGTATAMPGTDTATAMPGTDTATPATGTATVAPGTGTETPNGTAAPGTETPTPTAAPGTETATP